MADRGVSEPWDPQLCGALCKGVTQRLRAGDLGRCKPPYSGVRGRSPEANAFSQQLLKIRYLGRRLHPCFRSDKREVFHTRDHNHVTAVTT